MHFEVIPMGQERRDVIHYNFLSPSLALHYLDH